MGSLCAERCDVVAATTCGTASTEACESELHRTKLRDEPRRQVTLSLIALCSWLPVFAEPDESEAELIEQLIAVVRSSKDVMFIRNGDAGAPDAAPKHLKDKYDYFRNDIKTSDDFIRLCGTRSESTKKPYAVRLSDGRVEPAAQWLTSELQQLRAAR